MKTIIRTAVAGLFLTTAVGYAQTTYDSTSLVETNNNSTSTSTVNSTSTNTNTNNNVNTTTVNSDNTNTNINTNTSTSTNTNFNINSGEQTFNNNNVNTSTSTSTNTNNNINTSTSTSTNTNNNNNVNTSTSTNTNNNNNVSTNTNTNNNTTTSDNTNRNIMSGEVTNRNINENKIEQTIQSPPPSAIAPSMMSGGNNDLCTTGTSGAVQTQILGVSSGGTVRDLNCERLKNAKTLYDMGMKVAAVATLCQDRRVFDAMWNAGTPCPYEGMIGEQAKVAWTNNPDKVPKPEEIKGDDFYKKTGFGALLGYLLFLAL
jgi:hypothetical protein